MFSIKSRPSETQHTLMRIPEPEEVLNSIAVLEPEPVAPVIPVMERAKSAIAFFENSTDLELVNHEVARLTHEKGMLFGIEQEAAAALDQRLSEVKSEQHKARAFEKFAGEKLRVDNEVLTWRKPEPLYHEGTLIKVPEIGLFGLGQPWLRLTTRWVGHGQWEPALPRCLTELYSDVYNTLSSLYKLHSYRQEFSIFAAFTGVIPADTKKKIREAQVSRAFDDIRLLAEAEWAVQSTPSPLYADPIVVGLVEDEMWVIDVFDPTPLEEYIAREFTT